LFQYVRTPAGKESFDEFKIGLPLFGSLLKELYISRVSGNLSMMLRSGVSVVKTIESTAKVVDNVVYEKILMKVAEDVGGGKTLSESFSKHEKFTSIFIQMVKVGEESGKLSSILETMALFYEKEVINRTTSLISLIEPIMITLLGGGVGLLLASVLLPIYSVTNTAI
jgi:type IV pilus assembly protein PilC